ncbi:MAG: hypothetical protein ACREUL_16630 [Steroidobacteraceae bacterium]
MIDRGRHKRLRLASRRDKGYYTQKFVKALVANYIEPHIARHDNRPIVGSHVGRIYARTYKVSEIVRKRIEPF